MTEMKKVGQLFAMLLLTLLYCGCQSAAISQEAEDIISKIRKARDPQGKLATMQTELIKGEFRSTERKKPMTMELSFKKPDMMKVQVVIPGEEAFIKAYNGKQGWLFTTAKGVKEITGKPLDEMRLQALLLNPMPKLVDIFDSIELKGESIEVGEKCYKFVCKPKAEFNSQPITFFVSKKTHLIIKRLELTDTEDGRVIKTTTVFNDYRPEDGILVARQIISLQNGKLMEFNVKSVEWNAPLNVNDFNMPSKIK